MKTALLVVDILRASMHDGPGIRTTVFTKGCPLRCLWCHNPETQSTVRGLSFDVEKCVHCGACTHACAFGVHEVDETGHTLHRDRCKNCGKCVSACPQKAIKLVGEKWSPESIVDFALRDKAFFDRTKGGLTLSGGEPMSQFLPVKETLRLARDAGIHTCLDTSGQEATVTVINRNDLEAALCEPEQYGHLLVRLGGWCARFIDLSREIQEEIIRRTLY